MKKTSTNVMFRVRTSLAFLLFTITTHLLVFAQDQESVAETSAARNLVDRLLAFVYSLGHLIGEGIVKLVSTILPSMPVPSELIDPIGLLAILTIFLAIAAIAKRLVWIIVVCGWVLILVRLGIVIVQNYV